MVKGAPSLNPTGRPKGAAGLAKYIAQETDDGRELIDRLLALSRDPRAPVREATAATFALLDRLAGRPMQPSEISLAMSDQMPVGLILAMPARERLAWLDAERARRALPAGGGDS